MSGRTDTIITYDYEGCPTLAAFAKSDAKIRGVVGPFGSGKSSASVIEIPRRGRQQNVLADGRRRSRFAVIRNTMPQLKDTTMKTFFEWMPPAHFGDYKSSDQTFVINRWAEREGIEIEVLFRALDTPEDIGKLLSLDLTGAWGNEARELPWPIIEALEARLGRYPAQRDGGATWHGMWFDTNPPDVDSDWFKFFEESGATDDPTHAAIFHQPSGLSPQAENLANLPGGRKYYENLAKGKSQAWVDVYIHGKYGFVQSGKAIFPEYNDQVHCREVEPIAGVPVHRGWDWGLTPACALSQVLPTGHWLIFDELFSDDSGAEAFAESVISYCAGAFKKQPTFIDTGDPAGFQRAQTDEKTIFSIMHAKGIAIEPGLQSLAMRLEAIRKPLNTLIKGEPQLILHPRCKRLRRAFMGLYRYRRMKVQGERYDPVPEKNYVSHIMDGLEYSATRIFSSELLLSQEQRLSAQQQRELAESNALPSYMQEDTYAGPRDDGRSDVTGY